MGFYRQWQKRILGGLTMGLLLAGGAGGLGCSKTTGPGLRLRLAGTPVTGGCVQSSTMQPVEAMALLQNGSVRVTAVQHASDGQHLLCDATAKVPSETLDLDLGEVDRTTVDYYAEFFDGTGSRVASGALLASSNTTDTPTLHMFAASAWSCPPSKLGRARAFHSATVLPNGEVLLLGGIEALSAYGSDVFGLIDNAEIYDPRRATFVSLTASMGARAFHQVAVLDTSGTTVRLLVYGGVIAPVGQPALFVPDSPTQLRLMPGGNAEPGAAQLLVYDTAQRTLTASTIDVSTHKSAFAAGAALPGGGLVAVGGATFNKALPFSRSNPATLAAVSEAATLYAQGGGAPVSSFAPAGGGSPWLLGASATPLSTSTALVLGAKIVPDNPIKMQSLAIKGLPASAQFPTSVAVSGPSTVFHTATRLGGSIDTGTPTGPTTVLVTGGFIQDTNPPYTTRQPPTTAEAVRLYTVTDPAGALTPISYSTITPYMPTGACGMADGHYRPAGWESATATLSGSQVLITGGTPSVPVTGCADCEPTETGANKLLCVLRQASLFDATAQTLTAVPSLPLGRMGHQQSRLSDGNILISGGLVRSGGVTSATAEAEVYNPITTNAGATDPNDPLTALRAGGQAPACARL